MRLAQDVYIAAATGPGFLAAADLKSRLTAIAPSASESLNLDTGERFQRDSAGNRQGRSVKGHQVPALEGAERARHRLA